jgi:type VI secretion system secreted protein VgrG
MASTRNVDLTFQCGDSSLIVRTMRVREVVNDLFRVEVMARSLQEGLTFSDFVGREASLRVENPLPGSNVHERVWAGICTQMRSVRSEDSEKGISTFEIVIVPRLWLLTQRTCHRHFQHVSIPSIIDAILSDWQIVPEWRANKGAYPKLELRTQVGETDFAFFSRLLEEAGISYFFADDPVSARLVLHDKPQGGPMRPGRPLAFVDDASTAFASQKAFATELLVSEEARPGAVILRDYDPRNPRFHLFGAAFEGEEHERQYEQYAYAPGAFMKEGGAAGNTPVADDLGVARSDQAFGAARAQVALEALRTGKKQISLKTNAMDVAAGTVFAVSGHPRVDIDAVGLFVRAFSLEGDVYDEWTMKVEATPVTDPFRPQQKTAKPRMDGLQLAVIVGPEPGSIPMTGEPARATLPGMAPPESISPSIPGEDVYADEHGRVRVQFPWDRENPFSAQSSVWMRVAQSWAGAGHGLFSIPRLGTEVLVGYVGGDPDCPVVVGTLHNMVTPPPYKLPDNKSVTTWRTATSPGRDGFNELRFDDTAGREHLYIQAQQDMDHLVKNDKQEAVGRDRASFVQRDEARAVGHNLLDVIKSNATEVVGANQSSSVGLSRMTSVGMEDTTSVGSRWSVSVTRGLSAQLGPKLGQLLDGSLGKVMAAPATAVLGRITQAPLGGLTGGAQATLAAFRQKAPQILLKALGLGQGATQVEGPPPTTIEMVDRRIELTTGEASIILDGPNISLRASGNIVIEALKSVSVLAEEELALAGNEQVALLSLSDDVVVQAANMVKLNPSERMETAPPAEPRKEAGASPSLPKPPEAPPIPEDHDE